jgi:hypothetical protein
VQVLAPLQAAVLLMQAGPDFFAPLTVAQIASSAPPHTPAPAPAPAQFHGLSPIGVDGAGSGELDPFLFDPFDQLLPLPLHDAPAACKCDSIACCSHSYSFLEAFL